jgi:hypothetical protein
VIKRFPAVNFKKVKSIIKMKKISENAGATLEYLLLFTLFMGAVIVFQQYFLRAVGGNWKKAGDAFSHGRQYEPDVTVRCILVTGSWVTLPCFDECFLRDLQPEGTCKAMCGASAGVCS